MDSPVRVGEGWRPQTSAGIRRVGCQVRCQWFGGLIFEGRKEDFV